ncbi:MAG: tetratricopeptide repeat protein [Acidobacteria bacterium]|nr:tetratricopeptide repeat protein [Acidobacteriota bacterium]
MVCRLVRTAVLAALWTLCAAAQEDPMAPIAPLLGAGDAAYLKGDYDAARDAFAKAWDAAGQLPADAPARYDILKRLSSVRAAAGDFAGADEWLGQAIAWREAARGKEDPKIADDLLLSAGFQRSLKNYDRALEILRRVQGLHAAIYGPASPLYADDFTRMARVYAEQKQNVPAIAMHQIALGLRTRIAGPLDPTLVPDLDRLGELYTAERQYEKAEDAYRHDLVIRETIYGKVHADLISTVDGLAYALFGQKKYEAAEPVYRRLLGLWEGSVGKDHPMVAVTLDKIAVFYAEQKKYPEARDMLERSSAIRARFLAMGISQQATEAFGEGRAEDARAFYRRALAVLGEPNPANADLRAQFEEILKALDEPAPKPAAAPKRTAPATKKP